MEDSGLESKRIQAIQAKQRKLIKFSCASSLPASDGSRRKERCSRLVQNFWQIRQRKKRLKPSSVNQRSKIRDFSLKTNHFEKYFIRGDFFWERYWPKFFRFDTWKNLKPGKKREFEALNFLAGLLTRSRIGKV